jgi:hypothetical protein
MFAWAGIIGWETFLSGRLVPDVSAPAAFPSIICSLLGGLGAALIVDALRRRRIPAPQAEAVREAPGSRLRVLGVLGSLIVYAAVMPVLGFYIATPIAVAAMARFSGMRSPLALVLLAVVFTAMLYAFFSLLLRVPLPPGLTEDWRL